MSRYIGKHKRDGTYYLSKRINGKSIYIGTSTIWEVIRDLRKQCIAVGWDEEKVKQIKEQFIKDRPLLEYKYTVDHINEKYIFPYKTKQRVLFYIARKEEGKFVQYGKYRSLNEAKKYRKILIESGWDRSKVNISGYPRKPSNKLNIQRNIYYNPTTKRYDIKRLVNYQVHYFMSADTLEEAVRCRDILEANGWE